MMIKKLPLRSALVLLLALGAGTAIAITGTARMTLEERLSVDGCGSDTDVSRVVMNLRNNRTWRARTDAGTLTGDYRQRSAGRRIRASLDSRSRGVFAKSMARWSSQICRTRVTIERLGSVNVTLKLNKRRTKMTGRITARGRGTSSEGSGTGTFTGVLRGSFRE